MSDGSHWMHRVNPGATLRWTVLFIGGLIMITPLLYMFSSSLKPGADIYDLRLIPARATR